MPNVTSPNSYVCKSNFGCVDQSVEQVRDYNWIKFFMISEEWTYCHKNKSPILKNWLGHKIDKTTAKYDPQIDAVIGTIV